jgi:DNA-binding HxlR family transcriptional regulator
MATTTKPAREVEPGTYEAYMHDCPAVALLSTISNRWVSLTMCTLGSHGSAMRYSHVSREIPGVSQKMLTQTLRTLERDGLISRTVTADVPVRVSYALTPLGESLMPAVTAIKMWAEEHITDIAASRAAYDGRVTAV